MKEFKELSKDSYLDNEKKYIDYWKEIDVLGKSIEKGDKHWVFYDGPAFANGFPGLHHMVAKNLKDTIKFNVEDFTGMIVDCVNVHVKGIRV